MTYWICVCVFHRFLFVHDVDDLDGLFRDVLEHDYIEHFVVELNKETEPHDLNESGFYVFVHCHDYQSHVDAFYENRHVKNILDSYTNVYVIPPEEVFATRKNPLTIIQDEHYKVNRSGFFMPGDVVRITIGAMMNMQGVVLSHLEQPSFYNVLFRLFVKAFSYAVNVEHMEFVSSLFKHQRFPVSRAQSKKAGLRIQHKTELYKRLMQEAYEKRLVSKTDYLALRSREFDIVDLLHGNVDVYDVLS